MERSPNGHLSVTKASKLENNGFSLAWRGMNSGLLAQYTLSINEYLYGFQPIYVKNWSGAHLYNVPMTTRAHGDVSQSDHVKNATRLCFNLINLFAKIKHGIEVDMFTYCPVYTSSLSFEQGLSVLRRDVAVRLVSFMNP